MGAGTSPTGGTNADGTNADATELGGTGVDAAHPDAMHPDAAHPDAAHPDAAHPDGPADEATPSGAEAAGEVAEPVAAVAGAEPGGSGSTWAPSRRFSLTRDTARPEGGGRAAPGDAPAPARQWPLLTVLCTAGLGLLIVGTNAFEEAFRIGAILIGVALLGGAVLRWVVPSVGMLAVRSRFTDLVTYGLMGALIVLLALMAQPKPWLTVPFLQDAVHFTIR
ncbi:DUF3017 domain-containing protein [Streptomyces sp. NPDC059166]|uniref:DUF3017 domain-containing protein n=1 Tax=Streptomyces sp. NPDC059166 TaxID=3346752 RepID=UPI0036A90904